MKVKCIINSDWFLPLMISKRDVSAVYNALIMYLTTGEECQLEDEDAILYRAVRENIDRENELSKKRSEAGKKGANSTNNKHFAEDLPRQNSGKTANLPRQNSGKSEEIKDKELPNNDLSITPPHKSLCPSKCDIDKSLLSLSPTPPITNNPSFNNIYNINNNILNNNNSSKEKASKEKRSSSSSFSLEFVQPELLSVFQRFIAMRKAIGKAIKTQHTVQCRYNTLMRLSGGDIQLAVQIAEQSIDHEWEDFYSLKTERPKPKEQKVYKNEDYWK